MDRGKPSAVKRTIEETEPRFFFFAENEGEEIEVLEFGLDEAIQMIGRGEIQDGKTIMLLRTPSSNA